MSCSVGLERLRNGGDTLNADAKLTQASDMVPDHALLLRFAERRRFPVLERLSSLQYPIDQNQHDMRHGNQSRRFLPARSTDNPPELVLQRTVLRGRCRPGALRQRAAQPRIASGRVTALVLSFAAVVARADSRPRTQMLRGRKLLHVRSCFSQNIGHAAVLNARNRLHQLPGFLQARLPDLV